jgi:hypothetical protein
MKKLRGVGGVVGAPGYPPVCATGGGKVADFARRRKKVAAFSVPASMGVMPRQHDSSNAPEVGTTTRHRIGTGRLWRA